MKQILWWLALIGVPLSALSMVSLIQRWLDIGLIGGFGEIIDYYRTYARAIAGYLPDLFKLQVPSFVYDLWTLSLYLAAIQMRATLMTEASKVSPPERLRISYVVGGVLFLGFLTYSLLGLVFGLYSITSALSVLAIKGGLERISTPELPMRRYAYWLLGSLFASLAAVLLFYGLNAYAPRI